MHKTASLTLCTVTLVLFAWLLAHPYFVDPDSFYHIGVTNKMLTQRSLAIDFSALPLTTLETSFADQAWLYHLLLIPFLALFGAAGGIKAFAAVNAAAVIVSIYLIARRWRAPWPFVYPLMLLLTSPFVFRMALGKPSALAVLILIWGVYALTEKKYFLLFAMSIAFTWMHGSWPLLIGVSVIAALMEKQWPMFLTPLAGAAVGLIVHPYFPNHLSFFWQQTVLIGLKGYTTVLGVGREWYPYPLIEFIGDNLLLLALAASAILSMILCRERSPATRTLLWSSVALIILTLRANRNIEFLAPLLALFSARALAVRKELLASHIRGLLTRPSSRSAVAAMVAILCAISVVQVFRLKPLLAQGYRLDAFMGASQWLSAHFTPATLIINTRWEDFPALWYRNPSLRFVIGLDPAFLYLQNPAAYRAWQSLMHGENGAPDPIALRHAWGGDTLLVKKEFTLLRNTLNQSPLWTRAYEDAEADIFIPSPPRAP